MESGYFLFREATKTAMVYVGLILFLQKIGEVEQHSSIPAQFRIAQGNTIPIDSDANHCTFKKLLSYSKCPMTIYNAFEVVPTMSHVEFPDP